MQVGTVTCWKLPPGQVPGGRATDSEEESVAIAWARYLRDPTLSAADRNALALALWGGQPTLVDVNTWIGVWAEDANGNLREVGLVLTDAFAELVKTIPIPPPRRPPGIRTCPTCKGTGTELLVFLNNPCRTCNATGLVP